MPERSSSDKPASGSPIPTPAPDGRPTADAKFTLKTPDGKGYLSAPEAKSIMLDLIKRVEGETATRAVKVNPWPEVQSFAISGPQELIDRIAAQPEVARFGDHSSEDMVIRPVERRDASLSDAAERPAEPGSSGKRTSPKRKAGRKSSPSKGSTRRKPE